MNLIGKSLSRLDAYAKVTGQALFPGDVNYPGQVYMKVLFACRPHAIIRSIDTSKAEVMQGVLAVLTAKDVPVNEYGLIFPDQPVLCGPDSSNPKADHVRFIGDQIALVIAETEEIAARALKTIQVEFEDLPIVQDPIAAMDSGSYTIHSDRDSNVLAHFKIRKGNIEDAFTNADVIVEGEYHTPYQEHAFLQPEAGVSYIDEEDRITVVVAGQWVHEDQEQIAHALALPLEKIRVIYPAIGGAFGGREDMSVQIVLALGSWYLQKKGIQRPIKIIWSREESIIGHHKRHPFHIFTKWGADKNGKLVAAEVKAIADGGAYAYTSTKVLGNATLMCTGPYEIPNIIVDTYAVYTNNIPGGAFRGFGGPQAAFAAEAQMDKLADLLHMDPVELRLRNTLQEGSLLSVGTPLPKGVTITEVLKTCARTAGWQPTSRGWIRPTARMIDPKSPIRHGIGIACSFKNVGFSYGAPEKCTARVELYGGDHIEKAILFHAGADVGQGAHTAFAQMAASALDIDIKNIEMVVSDTALTENSGSASASRLTFMAGNSIVGAAKLALEKWNQEERPAVGIFEYRPPRTTPLDPETGKCEPNFAYGYVAEAVEVEVDTETGQIRLQKVICVDDVGMAINPMQVQGQIEGAVVQAAGYALMENLVVKDGDILTRGLSTYLIPTVMDIPDEVNSIIVENPDPIGPWGARGMGEMPYLALVPAITAAVFDAIGVWMDEFPLTPEVVLRKTGKLD